MTQIRGALDIKGCFVCFHIESCNYISSLNQAILRCFVSIQLNNHVIRQSKRPYEELGRHRMKIEEVFEDTTNWGNYIPSLKTSFAKESTQIDEKRKKRM